MIIKTNNDNVFNTKAKHIAFAINTEGYNDSGFAGQVSYKYWNDLAICGMNPLGTVLSKKVGDKTYHALVCHSLETGWTEEQAQVIKECFDKIPADGEEIASIAIGTGLIGSLSGANFRQIVCGMHDSKQRIILYTGDKLEQVLRCYEEEKEQIQKDGQMKLRKNIK